MVLTRSNNRCIELSGLQCWQAILWISHRVFAVHLKGTRRQGCPCRVHVRCQPDLQRADACVGSEGSPWPARLWSTHCGDGALKGIACGFTYLLLSSFSWGRFRKITLQMFPVLNWLFSYRFREWILRDLHAGLSVGMVQVPQGRQREKNTPTSIGISCFS